MIRKFVKGMLMLALVIPLMTLGNQALAASHVDSYNSQPDNQIKEATVTVDNVTLAIHTPFMPGPIFTTSDPGMPSQGATWTDPSPYSELDVLAVPFGTNPLGGSDPANPLPPAQLGIAAAYRAKLREYKVAIGGNPQPGPTTTLFGQKVESDVSFLELKLNTLSDQPTLYVEWVVEAGPRIWIVRIVKQLPAGTKDLTSEAAFLKSLGSLTISSDNLDSPSTLKPAIGAENLPGLPPTGIASTREGNSPNPTALLLALLGGLLIMSGVVLRSKRNFRL